MPAPLRIFGTVASPGYAAGPLYRLDRLELIYAGSGDAATEAARLRDAIAGAGTAVAGLMATADDEAAGILEFQVAMLEDESLAEPAFAAIACGADAVSAWTAALEAQIAEYTMADDGYFRARSADLADIRDRVTDILAGAANGEVPPGSVVVGADISPTTFLSADWTSGGGIVLEAGSARGHVAMLARARGVPMLVAAGAIAAAKGERVLLDAEHGGVTVRPSAEDDAEFVARSEAWAGRRASAEIGLLRPAVTRDGVAVTMLVNLAEPNEVDRIDAAACDGVGLMRTEFLFGHGLPDEETQFSAYARVLRWAGDKPVTIRTVDAGGDKPVPGFTMDEQNPFLGVRGIRLSLSRPEVFRMQIRALLRAGALGKLRVMLPMVTVAGELAAAKALFAEEAAALGLPVPPLGIMVEVPAVALAPELFAEAAFFSVGSNDLTQYAMAAARDNGAVAGLNDATHPAVIRLIENAVRGAAALNIPISICGDAAGDVAAIPALLKTGLRTLSVAPAQLALVKEAVRAATVGG